jgi:hypothetical protein
MKRVLTAVLSLLTAFACQASTNLSYSYKVATNMVYTDSNVPNGVAVYNLFKTIEGGTITAPVVTNSVSPTNALAYKYRVTSTVINDPTTIPNSKAVWNRYLFYKQNNLGQTIVYPPANTNVAVRSRFVDFAVCSWTFATGPRGLWTEQPSPRCWKARRSLPRRCLLRNSPLGRGSDGRFQGKVDLLGSFLIP